MLKKRVLSIQSHVVSGHVGNKSATFPLQLMGFEVDPINSVQFSNHTGYKNGWKGDVLKSSQLLDLFQGLLDNDLAQYSHFLTGYVGDSSFLQSICTIYKKLKELNPNLVFVCDPVLGDEGILYVPPELVSIYKYEILPLTNILTPNQFEAELLTDMKIKKEEDIWVIMQKLHNLNIQTIVLSSCDIGPPDLLYAYASKSNGLNSIKVKVEMKRYDAHFVGTGDLFCALFLAWNDLYKEDLKMVCDKVISTMQVIIQRTVKYALNYIPNDDNSAKYLELQLVGSKKDIENPPNIVSSKYIEF